MLLTLVLVCVAALALLIAVPAYIAFATHNRLVALDQRCETAFGEIDVHHSSSTSGEQPARRRREPAPAQAFHEDPRASVDDS